MSNLNWILVYESFGHLHFETYDDQGEMYRDYYTIKDIYNVKWMGFKFKGSKVQEIYEYHTGEKWY